jgi:hypothetical protein
MQAESRAGAGRRPPENALLSPVSHRLHAAVHYQSAVSSIRSGMVDWDTEARVGCSRRSRGTDHLQPAGRQPAEHVASDRRAQAGRNWNSLARSSQRDQPPAPGHKFKSICPSLPLVPVDYAQMEQVFTNLISTASSIHRRAA